jgi:SAM-dependent methyltransferase
VLDLGCGTGRVALHLARQGRRVTGLDNDACLLEALAARAAQDGLTVSTVRADAREFDLGVRFDTVFAPMQLIQLFRGPAERSTMLTSVARHLREGGVFAATLMNLEGEPLGDDYGPPRPDVRTIDGWVYSSLSRAADLVDGGEAIRIERVRTAVSPAGEEFTSVDEVRLELLAPAALERETADAGLEVHQRRAIPPTEHVGSFVVIALRPHPPNG